MKEASHTRTTGTSGLRLLPGIGRVDLADPSLPGRLAGKVSGQLELFAAEMRQGLLAASVAIGLEVMGELVDAEVAEVAGPKGRHDPGRTAYRHGGEEGKVTLGGRRVPVRRPRVRTVEGAEVRLESYDTFASVDLLAEHMVASMLAGAAVGAAIGGRCGWAGGSSGWGSAVRSAAAAGARTRCCRASSCRAGSMRHR